MTFWLETDWQERATRAVEDALDRVHARLAGEGRGPKDWTVGVLQAFVPVARALCDERVVCGLKCPPDERCKGEWLYDFCCWIEGAAAGEGFLGMPFAVESEWGGWNDVWDDLDKLTQARAGLRVFIFDARWAPKDWHQVMSQRIARFVPMEAKDAWLFAGWETGGFTYRSGLIE